MAVPGWPVAFRGTDAIRAGLVTPGQLRGPNYLRLFPDTYVRRGDEPPDLVVRSLAAYLYTGRRGILSGYSAAEVQQASCGPLDAPAELTLPGGGHPRPGLLVHRDRLDRDEIQMCRGLPVTTRSHGLRPGPLAGTARRGRGRGGCAGESQPGRPRSRRRRVRPRGRAAAGEAVSGSTRERPAAAGRRAGRPAVRVAHGDAAAAGWCSAVSPFPRCSTRCWTIGAAAPCGYPEHRVGIEYEGADHANPDRVLRDVGRYTRLVADSWRIYRFTKFAIYGEQDRIAATIWRALGR
jgi:hypothetical protein